MPWERKNHHCAQNRTFGTLAVPIYPYSILAPQLWPASSARPTVQEGHRCLGHHRLATGTSSMKHDWLPSSLCAKIRAVDTCFVGCDRIATTNAQAPTSDQRSDRRDRRHWPVMALARHGTGPTLARHWPGRALARHWPGICCGSSASVH